MNAIKISDKVSAIFEKKTDWWYDNVTRPYYYGYIVFPIHDFLTGIKNIIRWIPFLWNDRDFQSSFTIKMLIRKLQYQRDYLDKHSIEVREHLDLKLADMDKVIALLKKSNDCFKNYEMQAIADFEKVWGVAEIYFEETPDGRTYEMKDRSDDNLTPEQLIEKGTYYRKLNKEAVEQRDKDFKKAMMLIVKRSDSWWH